MQTISRETAREIGLKRYFTGKPCWLNHVSERSTATGVCFLCAAGWREANADDIREKEKQKREQKKTEVEKEREKIPGYVSRATAQRLGLKRYFPGTPCKHGHVAEWITSRRSCSVCDKRTIKNYQESHREELRERQRVDRAVNPERHAARRRAAGNKLGDRPFDSENSVKIARIMLQVARQSARRKGMDFNLTVTDLLPLPTHCPVFGTKLDYHRGPHGNPQRASLDRVDNSQGYVSGNVAIVSLRANEVKRDATLDQTRAILRYLEAYNAFPY